jgi:tetratricopeptide (TPR) repeat protein
MDIGKYEESIKYFEKALGLVRDLDLKERIVFNLALAY